MFLPTCAFCSTPTCTMVVFVGWCYVCGMYATYSSLLPHYYYLGRGWDSTTSTAFYTAPTSPCLTSCGPFYFDMPAPACPLALALHMPAFPFAYNATCPHLHAQGLIQCPCSLWEEDGVGLPVSWTFFAVGWSGCSGLPPALLPSLPLHIQFPFMPHSSYHPHHPTIPYYTTYLLFPFPLWSTIPYLDIIYLLPWNCSPMPLPHSLYLLFCRRMGQFCTPYSSPPVLPLPLASPTTFDFTHSSSLSPFPSIIWI